MPFTISISLTLISVFVFQSYGRINTCQRLIRDMKDTRLLNEGDKKGMTPLHLAAQNGHEKVVQFLLKRGALFLWYVFRLPFIKVKNSYHLTFFFCLSTK